MRRLFARKLALLCSLTLVCGCQSVTPFNWSERINPKGNSAADPSVNKEAATEDNHSHEEQTVAVEKSETIETAPVEIAEDEATTTEPAEKKSGNAANAKLSEPITHDAETLHMMEEELRLADADERDALFNEWKQLHPAIVRQVILIRRMMRQTAAQIGGDGNREPPSLQSTGTEDESESTDESDIHLAVATEEGREYSRSVTQNRLGGPSPWKNDSVESDSTVAAEPKTLAPEPFADQNETTSPRESSAHSGRLVPNSSRDLPDDARMLNAPIGPAPSPENAQLHESRDSLVSSLPPWNVQLDRFLTAAEQQAAQALPGKTVEDRQAYVEAQVHLRMLYLMSGQPERAMEPIPHLESAEQEFWQQTFFSLANYFDVDAVPEQADRAAQTVNQLRRAVQSLQSAAKLELRNLAFCRRIDSFGTFEQFQSYEFAPGQPVLLYAEVRNFQSRQNAAGQFRTVLKSTLELFNSQGELVQKMEFPPTEDLCGNYRMDYFHSYELAVPTKNIRPGPHTLKLTVEDLLSRKIAEDSINFTVK